MIDLPFKSIVRTTFRESIKNPTLRRFVNYAVDRAPLTWKKRFHGAFGSVFNGYGGDWADGIWRFTFLGKEICIPLEKGTLATDWITVATIMGHDIAEKTTYMELLSSNMKPNLFIDVGGNLGTHSLLMLSQGVEVMYIEPNEVCQAHFRRYCDANGFLCELQMCAAGAVRGSALLKFPVNETWLGSTRAEMAIAPLMAEKAIVEYEVPVSTLDELCSDVGGEGVLVKIDAEGSEHDILLGGRDFIRRVRPFILFECHLSDDRLSVWSFFDQLGYEIYAHPFPSRDKCITNLQRFAGYADHNFIGVPRPPVESDKSLSVAPFQVRVPSRKHEDVK